MHRDQRSILFCDPRPTEWAGQRGRRGLAWSEGVPDRSGLATTWREAAALGAAGLQLDRDECVLHATGAGVGLLYWMRAGEAVYFASAADALARAQLGSLSPDWDAWSAILANSHPVRDTTPFAEIRLLRPLAGLRANRTGIEQFEGGLTWAEHDVPAGDPAAAIAESLRRQAEALQPLGPIGCPLSGGWDSRAIATTLAERGLVREAFTTNADRGDADEEILATPVASQLDLTHSVVHAGPGPFAQELSDAARAVEYQSSLDLHMRWLVQALPAGDVWSDGIAGDVLIKPLYMSSRVHAAPDLRSALARMLDFHAPPQVQRTFSRRAWRAIRGRTRAVLLDDGMAFEGHPGAFTLGLWWSRSRRLAAPSATVVVGRRHGLYLPFLDPGLAAAALATPSAQKLHGGLYRRVLEHLDPKIARLPSSNDKQPRQGTHPSLIRSAAGQAARLDLLARSPLRRWFSAGLERAVESRDLASVDARARSMRRVEAICTFGLWCEEYRDLIGEPDPAVMFE